VLVLSSRAARTFSFSFLRIAICSSLVECEIY
jgi:hypothetical protein